MIGNKVEQFLWWVQRIKTTFKFWIKIYVLWKFYFRPHRVPGTSDLAYPRTSEKSRHYNKLLGQGLTNLFESLKWFWWQIRFSDPIRPSLFLTSPLVEKQRRDGGDGKPDIGQHHRALLPVPWHGGTLRPLQREHWGEDNIFGSVKESKESLCLSLCPAQTCLSLKHWIFIFLSWVSLRSV